MTSTTSGPSSSSSSTSSTSSSGGGGVIGEPIAIGTTSASLQVEFEISAQGTGSDLIGAIAITSNSGTVVISGETLPLVVYERQPFKDYFLYQSLVVAPDRLYVVWLYCLGNVLQGVYYEGTNGLVLGSEGATGACAESETPITTSASFGAVTMAYPALVSGFSIDGAAISLEGSAPGTIAVGGKQHVLLAFASVDCSLCGEPGWWEAHALLWDGNHVCFGILYLIDGKTTVQLDYALCLPELADPFGAVLLDAQWSHP